MLEVKNLKKTYTTKKGVETKALDDVSIQFPEKGLVFLLGKSGSGKSTLLNLCGGLDRADSGEIIIMGRSSRDFKPTDFDSYRNTFIGFVFQEYNLLEEFTVEDNIALALELQNKKRDSDKIAEILKSVELEAFAKRKPNTLSGGQKQRVAIARALVKDPRIILADEPTGALDSETGKQVLETLKKLSSDKLVIVVSHDREFAESYADRIIELKDGKIISDRTRSAPQKGGSEPNVQFDGQSITVRDSAALTDDDLRSIKELLAKSSGKIAVAEKTDGAGDAFSPTCEQPHAKEYTEQEQAMISSHLPLRHAVRMGITSIKLKPVRLIFTIFLTLIAFIVFGLFSAIMFYNEQTITRETLINSDIQFLNYQKAVRSDFTIYTLDGGERVPYNSGQSIASVGMTQEEYEALTAAYPDSIAAFSIFDYISGLTLEDTRFYSDTYQGFAYAKDEGAVELVAGRMPQGANEAIISDYTFDSMASGTLTDRDGNEVVLSGYEDYVKIPVQDVYDRTLTIVGVYQSDNIPQKYAPLKEASDRHTYTEDNGNNWLNYELRSGFYSYLIVDYDRADVWLDYMQGYESRPVDTDLDDYFLEADSYIYLNSDDESTRTPLLYMNTYDDTYGLELLPLYDLTVSREVTGLSEGEIAISVATYADFLESYLYDAVGVLIDELDETGQFNLSTQLYYRFYNDISAILSAISGYEVTDRTTVRQYLTEVSEFMEEWGFELSATLQNATLGLDEPVTIAALFFGYDRDGYVYLSPELFEAFFRSSNTLYIYEYSTAYTPLSGAYIDSVFINRHVYEPALRELVASSFEVHADDSTVLLSNDLMNEITNVHSIIHGLRYLSLGLWLGFTLFAVLLMFNFISASITAKKKEIGVLRAIGARSLDVFKIFLSESLAVAAICLVLSVVGCAVLCPVLSAMIIEGSAINVTILVFTPLTFLFMLLVAVFTAVVSTLIPVAIYSKKPPVDSIRAL